MARTRGRAAIQEALRNAFRRELLHVLDALDGPQPLTDTAVHTARRGLKRARAHLRLLRPALGDARYRRANARARDAARPLSHLRDADVLGELIAGLHARRDDRDPALARVQRSLATRRRSDAATLARDPQGLRAIRTSLQALLRTSARWRFAPGSDAELPAALARVFRRGRHLLAAARERPDVHTLHEWRKQVKYLADALRALEPYGPPKLHKLGRRARRLAERLGEQHDHAVLLEALAAPGRLPRAGVRRLARRLAREDAESLAEAFELGERLYGRTAASSSSTGLGRASRKPCT